MRDIESEMRLVVVLRLFFFLKSLIVKEVRLIFLLSEIQRLVSSYPAG